MSTPESIRADAENSERDEHIEALSQAYEIYREDFDSEKEFLKALSDANQDNQDQYELEMDYQKSTQ